MNKVIILDVTFGGYGVVKALDRYDVPMIGLYHADRRSDPEVHTSLCKTQEYANTSELLTILLDIAYQEILKPVVILTSDVQVEFYNNNRGFFDRQFLVNEPDEDTINQLLFKPAFDAYAKDNDCPVPTSSYISSPRDAKLVDYPAFVKPAFKWSLHAKGILCDNSDEAAGLLEHTDDLIAQEFIPGPTTNIFSVYVYYDSHGKCVHQLTGVKLREWPITNGTGGCLMVMEDDEITQEAIKFFDKAGYKGFGSLEVKRHSETGKLYVIEPTVGRVDENSEFVTINGINLPAIHYSRLTGYQLWDMVTEVPKKYWIHELLDFQSALACIKKNPLCAFGILKTYWNGHFHLWNRKDMLPFWLFFKRRVLKIH